MRYLFLLLLLIGCTDKPARTDGLEDGYYVTSTDEKISFFCTSVYRNNNGINGNNCVDMTCKFAGDRRIRSDIALTEGVIMETKGFNYKLVSCGPKE